MGLAIRTNASALNAFGNLKKNDKNSTLSLEKLASGYKINRSADDASGLAISEKMRQQITALETYSDNAENGINLIQTAEGYMAEVGDILNRCVELSVKAANGIYTTTERNIVQDEVNKLHEEIDRISETANFNELKLLQGPKTEVNVITSKPIIISTLPPWGALSSNFLVSDTYTPNGSSSAHPSATFDASAFTGSPADIQAAVGTGFHTTCCTCTNHYSIEFTADTKSSYQASGMHNIYKIGIGNCQTADDVYKAIINGTNSGRPKGHYTQFLIKDGKLLIYDNRAGMTASPGSDRGILGAGVAYDPDDITQEKTTGAFVSINVGHKKVGKILIGLSEISTSSLGIGGVSVGSQEGAGQAIDIYREAIDKVSLHRSIFGALQNRVDYTINNLNATYENTSAAKSRIKDTDMAKEMAEFTKNNILIQASQSMIAQANTQAQNVLQLLQ